MRFSAVAALSEKVVMQVFKTRCGIVATD